VAPGPCRPTGSTRSPSPRTTEAGTPQIVPSQVHRYAGQSVTLVGQVVATRGDAHSNAGMHFVLSDPNKRTGRVAVVYHGSVPDLYKVGRIVVVPRLTEDCRADSVHGAGVADTKPK